MRRHDSPLFGPAQLRDPVVGHAVGAIDVLPYLFGLVVKGIDVLPDDFVVRSYLKGTPGRALGDQGIPIGQALRRTHVETEETKAPMTGNRILPDGLHRDRVDFENS